MILDLGLAHVWCGMVSHVNVCINTQNRNFLAVTRVLGDDIRMYIH